MNGRETMQDNEQGQNGNLTFRGRSMQDAIAQLKDTLGPDAVIVSTRRGTDQQGRFVEITVAAQAAKPPQPVAMGGRRGASAAYERTATTTAAAPAAGERPSLLASAIRGNPLPPYRASTCRKLRKMKAILCWHLFVAVTFFPTLKH